MGGIRCEKSTAFLAAEGLDEVYHLQGGILKYLETIPPEQSLWEAEVLCSISVSRWVTALGWASMACVTPVVAL